MTPVLSLDEPDLILVALALESFAGQSQHALRALDDSAFMRPVRRQLQQQIDQANALLQRINQARHS